MTPGIRAPAAAVGLLLSTPSWASCPSTTAEVVAQAEEAREAFVALDELGFVAARDHMREGLSCLSDAPVPEQVAQIHLAEALAWFQVRDHARTVAALRSMRTSDPGRTLGEDLAPPDGDLRAWAMEAVDGALVRAPQQLPPGCALWVDGAPSDSLPTDRPSVAVLLGPDGAVAWSGLLPPGASLPSVALPDSSPAPASASRRPGRGTLIAAGSGALLTVGLWTGAALAREELLDLQGRIAAGASPEELVLDGEDLEARYARARLLWVGAELGTGLSLGLGGVGLVLSW